MANLCATMAHRAPSVGMRTIAPARLHHVCMPPTSQLIFLSAVHTGDVRACAGGCVCGVMHALHYECGRVRTKSLAITVLEVISFLQVFNQNQHESVEL